MKWIGSLIKKLLFLLILIIIVVVAARNFIVKKGVAVGAKVAAGVDLTIADVKIGVTKSDLRLKGIQLQNPKGFPKERMIDIPEVYINYNLRGFFNDAIHAKEIELNLNEFVVVKNKEGKINIKEIIPKSEEKAEDSEDQEDPEKEESKKKIKIDNLKLKIGTVVYKDYSVDPPVIKTFKVDIDEEINDVSTKSLIAYICSKALFNTTIGQLANIDIEELTGQVKDFANETIKNIDPKNIDKTVDDLGKKAKDVLKGLGF